MVEVARLAIPPHVADRVLNHQSGTISGIAAVYNRFAYLDERRDALNAWGRFGEGLAQSEEVASPSSQSAAPSGRDGPYGGSAKRKLAVAVDLNDRSLVDRTW